MSRPSTSNGGSAITHQQITIRFGVTVPNRRFVDAVDTHRNNVDSTLLTQNAAPPRAPPTDSGNQSQLAARQPPHMITVNRRSVRIRPRPCRWPFRSSATACNRKRRLCANRRLCTVKQGAVEYSTWARDASNSFRLPNSLMFKWNLLTVFLRTSEPWNVYRTLA